MSNQDLKFMIEKYKRFQMEIKELEAKLKPMKEVLETEAVNHGGELIVDCFKIRLVECKRETVAIEEAKVEFGEKLNKFLKVSFFTQLRVS